MAQLVQPPANDSDSERILAVKLVRTLESIYGEAEAPSGQLVEGPVNDSDDTRICLLKACRILEANL